MARTPDCKAEGRGFESRTRRKKKKEKRRKKVNKIEKLSSDRNKIRTGIGGARKKKKKR